MPNAPPAKTVLPATVSALTALSASGSQSRARPVVESTAARLRRSRLSAARLPFTLVNVPPRYIVSPASASACTGPSTSASKGSTVPGSPGTFLNAATLRLGMPPTWVKLPAA